MMTRVVKRLLARSRHVLADDRGGIVGEYGLLLAGVVAFTITAVATLTGAMGTLMTGVAAKLTAAIP